MPRITHFCSSICVLGCRLSLVRLCDSDFGITPVDDITIGITYAAFCFHITHISFASSWYLFCLSVTVLARLCVFGTAISIKKNIIIIIIKVCGAEISQSVCWLRRLMDDHGTGVRYVERAEISIVTDCRSSPPNLLLNWYRDIFRWA